MSFLNSLFSLSLSWLAACAFSYANASDSVRPEASQSLKNAPEDNSPTATHVVNVDWDASSPRGRTREIDFTTEEGTWTSVDISPDAQWIVFDLAGHIYRLPVQGGDAVALTQNSGIALNQHPSISPDGKQIAFISDRSGQDALWLMNANGTNQRQVFMDPMGRFSHPTWSPDGESLAAVRHYRTGLGMLRRNPRLWLFPLDGTPPKEIIGNRFTFYRWPSFSPDGKTLYTHASYFTGSRFGSEAAWHLREVDIATGEISFVHEQARQSVERSGNLVTNPSATPPRGENVMAPEISPDGSKLAFARQLPGKTIRYRGHEYGPRTALFIRDLDTGEERKLMDPIELDLSMVHTNYHSRILPGYAWAPDSASIVIPEGGKIRRVYLKTGEIKTIPFQARIKRTISEQARPEIEINDDTFRLRFLYNAASNKHGTRLAVVGAGRVYIMDLPDGAPRALTPDWDKGQQISPVFSPDGDQIAFATWDEYERGHIWIAPFDGSAPPRRVTQSPGEYAYPDWSPDGQHIVFTIGPQTPGARKAPPAQWNGWNDPGDWRIARAPVVGGEAIALAKTPFMQRPAYGADGRVYWQDAAGEKTIRRVRVPYPSDEDKDSKTPIRAIAPDETDPQMVLNMANTFSFAPFPRREEAALSPDRQWIAYQCAHQIFVRPLTEGDIGKKPITITPDTAIEDPHRIKVGVGIDHRWRNATTIEFTSGSKYFAYDIKSGLLTEREINLHLPRARGHGAIGFRNAKIITLGDQGSLERGNLLIRDARIACVGNCDLSTADRIIDAQGKTIVPGFIDVHEHTTMELSSVFARRRPLSVLPLAYGVTTLLDPGGGGRSTAYLLSELTEAGDVIGSRVMPTGSSIIGYDAHEEIDNYAEAAQEVDRRAEWGAGTIKNYLQNNRVQQQMLVEAARARGLGVTSEGGNMQHSQLAQTMDGHTGFEHLLPYLPLRSDLANFYGEAGVFYSPTLHAAGHPQGSMFYFRPRHDFTKDQKMQALAPGLIDFVKLMATEVTPITNFSFPILAEGLKDVIAAGGYGALGEHREQPGLGTHWEMWTYSAALDPIDVLKIASPHAAKFIGLENETGRIEAGLLADLVILNADPLEDIRNTLDIAYVAKAGIIFDGENMDKLWPVSEPFSPTPWTQASSRLEAASDAEKLYKTSSQE